MRYIRDKEGREVDFAILREGLLEELIEVKYGDEAISLSLSCCAERFRRKRALQIVAGFKRSYDQGGISVIDPVSCF